MNLIRDVRKLKTLNNTIEVQCCFAVDKFSETDFAKYNVAYPTHLSKGVKKRKSEYLAGRFVAKKALQELGIDRFEIATGDHREPIWPNNIIGSISHCVDTAVAVVSKTEHYSGLGIDIENIIQEQNHQVVFDQVLTKSEKLHFSENVDNQILTCIFAIKEAFFKAAFNQVRVYFGFEVIRVEHIAKLQVNKLIKADFTLQKNLSPHLQKGQSYTANVSLLDGYVKTLVAL